MDEDQAYAIAVFGPPAVAATVVVICVAIRGHVRRCAQFALIRQDLAEVRNGHAHLLRPPSGSSIRRSPGLYQEPDGPKPAVPACPHPSTGRVRRVVGLTTSQNTVSPTTSKAA